MGTWTCTERSPGPRSTQTSTWAWAATRSTPGGRPPRGPTLSGARHGGTFAGWEAGSVLFLSEPAAPPACCAVWDLGTCTLLTGCTAARPPLTALQRRADQGALVGRSTWGLLLWALDQPGECQLDTHHAVQDLALRALGQGPCQSLPSPKRCSAAAAGASQDAARRRRREPRLTTTRSLSRQSECCRPLNPTVFASISPIYPVSHCARSPPSPFVSSLLNSPSFLCP